MKKCILITGASSGIGLATAHTLAQQGHTVIASARRAEALTALEKEYPNRVFAFPADVCDVEAMKALVKYAIERGQKLDVLINNAGLGIFDPLPEGKLEDWHTMVDVNIKGLLNATHAAIPALRESRGAIINLTSVAAHNVFPNSGIYCATKHAVLAISESLRLELGTEIRITSISPGSVHTEFIDQTKNEELLKNYKDYFASGLKAQDIADQISHVVNAHENTVISEIIVRPNKAVK